MNANPFVKDQFKCYRDWEDALVAFLSHEARDPSMDRWLEVGADERAKEAATFCALLLGNLLTKKAGFVSAGEKAYEAYAQLSGGLTSAREYEQWFRTGWLNVSRAADALSAKLRKSL